MDNSGCEWIRGRLPLYMGAGDGLDEPDDEGSDLGVGDRRAIERHLAGCPGCRARRADLAGAMGVLAITAGAAPIATETPSLWPALERRIASHRAAGAVEARETRTWEPAAGPAPIWSSLDDERPLQAAWLQDTLREVAEAVGLGGRPGRSGRARVPAGVWRAVGVGLAASLLLMTVVLPVAWRLRAVAEARTLAYATPVPPLVGPPVPAGTEIEIADLDADAPESAPVLVEHHDLDARQLAQADPIKPPALPAPPAAAPTGQGPQPGATRMDYDLEHGTPMPPDGRDARPVY